MADEGLRPIIAPLGRRLLAREASHDHWSGGWLGRRVAARRRPHFLDAATRLSRAARTETSSGDGTIARAAGPAAAAPAPEQAAPTMPDYISPFAASILFGDGPSVEEAVPFAGGALLSREAYEPPTWVQERRDREQAGRAAGPPPRGSIMEGGGSTPLRLSRKPAPPKATLQEGPAPSAPSAAPSEPILAREPAEEVAPAEPALEQPPAAAPAPAPAEAVIAREPSPPAPAPIEPVIAPEAAPSAPPVPAEPLLAREPAAEPPPSAPEAPSAPELETASEPVLAREPAAPAAEPAAPAPEPAASAPEPPQRPVIQRKPAEARPERPTIARSASSEPAAEGPEPAARPVPMEVRETPSEPVLSRSSRPAETPAADVGAEIAPAAPRPVPVSPAEPTIAREPAPASEPVAASHESEPAAADEAPAEIVPVSESPIAAESTSSREPAELTISREPVEPTISREPAAPSEPAATEAALARAPADAVAGDVELPAAAEPTAAASPALDAPVPVHIARKERPVPARPVLLRRAAEEPAVVPVTSPPAPASVAASEPQVQPESTRPSHGLFRRIVDSFRPSARASTAETASPTLAREAAPQVEAPAEAEPAPASADAPVVPTIARVAAPSAGSRPLQRFPMAEAAGALVGGAAEAADAAGDPVDIGATLGGGIGTLGAEGGADLSGGGGGFPASPAGEENEDTAPTDTPLGPREYQPDIRGTGADASQDDGRHDTKGAGEAGADVSAYAGDAAGLMLKPREDAPQRPGLFRRVLQRRSAAPVSAAARATTTAAASPAPRALARASAPTATVRAPTSTAAAAAATAPATAPASRALARASTATRQPAPQTSRPAPVPLENVRVEERPRANGALLSRAPVGYGGSSAAALAEGVPGAYATDEGDGMSSISFNSPDDPTIARFGLGEIQGAVGGIASGARNIGSAITHTAQGVGGAVSDTVHSVGGTISDTAASVSSAVGGAAGEVAGAAQGVASAAKAALGGGGDIDEIYEQIVERLKREALHERERMGDLLGDLP